MIRNLALAVLLGLVSVASVGAAEIDQFEGLWVALYPGQPFERDSAEFLSVYVMNEAVFVVETLVRFPGVAGTIQFQDGVVRLADRFGTTEYRIDEDDTDVMFRNGVSGSRQDHPVVRYVRFRREFLEAYPD